MSGSDSTRLSTADREDAVSVLGGHFAEGRLTADEYEERVTATLAAKTRGELRALFVDLPPPHPVALGTHVPAPPPPAAVVPVTTSEKSKIVAGVLQIALPFGVGRFYTGHTGLAVAQLLVCLFTFGAAAIWPVIDGILLLIRGGVDAQGRRLAT
ncbi:DUF1707 domain-containing protein [Amycolatopsis suaedae]|uniref:DUF1707 domain-containing protein n=1 Tax=Amycolatopsis suaedae TaxID=2510978 RepID=A0A4Q7IZ46_9PSEU|nr:DUF1707 domain-containing protein [Amycolatopsis suaedae]RZQ60300.1 DUF1707 domain-containing protein [Amycolatopsis suaedae]